MVSRKSPLSIIEEFTARAPVDVVGMARELGLSVIEEQLPPNVSGKITRKGSGDDNYVITVSSAHPETRKRFTIAHEIAHFIFHRSRIGDGVIENGLYRSTQLSDAVERQANQYAACILMPHELVYTAWREGKNTPAELADYFGVSAPVAKIRIEELSLTQRDK
jgi:Zn-dependent peptidase ImmA (M78 family)